MKNKFFITMSTLLVLLASTSSFAAETVKGQQLKQLVTGKTIQAKHLIKGFTFSVYFDADGKTAIRKQKGQTTKTSYRFKGDQHCLLWKGKDRCAQIIDNGDGTFARINASGKKIISWTKIEDGKKL